jgi:glucokinase
VVKDLKEIYKQSYQNRFFSSFTEVCNKFLSDAAVNDNPPLLGCFAMAGPVHNNQVKMSNVPEIWRKDPTVPTADGDELAKTLGIKRIILVNDFVGTGYG